MGDAASTQGDGLADCCAEAEGTAVEESLASRSRFCARPGDSQLMWCNPSVPIHSSSLITLRAGENTASQLYGPCGGLQRDMEGNPLQPTVKIERQQRSFSNGVKYWDTT